MNKDQYIMMIAEAVKTRATCPDLKVGCVIVSEKHHILSTGYNGVPRGERHCPMDEFGRCMENLEKVHRVIHAEENAIIQAARHGTSLRGSKAYVTEKPCHRCMARMKQAGVESVTFQNSGSTETVKLV